MCSLRKQLARIANGELDLVKASEQKVGNGEDLAVVRSDSMAIRTKRELKCLTRIRSKVIICLV